MRTDGFRAWLKANKKNVENTIACCRRVENALGNLDLAFDADGLDSMIEHLSYTKADERANRLPPDGISFKDGASIYDGMATLKRHVKTYRDFRREQGGIAKHQTLKKFNPGLRDLFKCWLVSPAGGGHTRNVANSYGTHVENSGILIPPLFDETVEGIDMGAVRKVATDISVGLQLAKGDIRSGLIALGRFFKWIVEHSWCKSNDELATYLPTNEKNLRAGGVKGPQRPKVEEWDAYQLFFDYFAGHQMSPQEFYKFGIDNSVFADKEDVKYAERQFDDLIGLLKYGRLPNDPAGGRQRKDLAIRKYSGSKSKSEMFVELYRKLFQRASIRVESNATPKLNFRSAVKCEMFSAGYVGKETTTVLKNYVCSHVFDNRTQNPLLFEAVWNIVLTPKIIDPLTGNETKGRWPDEFQPLFRDKIRDKFLPCIRKFNAIAAEVHPQIEKAALEVAQRNALGEEDRNRFIENAIAQWEQIPERHESDIKR